MVPRPQRPDHRCVYGTGHPSRGVHSGRPGVDMVSMKTVADRDSAERCRPAGGVLRVPASREEPAPGRPAGRRRRRRPRCSAGAESLRRSRRRTRARPLHPGGARAPGRAAWSSSSAATAEHGPCGSLRSRSCAGAARGRAALRPRARFDVSLAADMSSLLSLVIPVYNEADSLQPLVAEIDEALTAAGLRFEIVFVDDGSTDGSFAGDAGAGGEPRRRARRQAAPQLRQGRRTLARVRGVPRRRRRHAGRRPPGRPRRDPAARLASGRRLRPRVGLEAEPPGPAEQDTAVAALQLDGAADVGSPAARLQLRPQGIPPGGRGHHPRLRRAAPLHPGRRGAGRVPRHRGACAPPQADGGRVQVRLAALPARLPRPDDGPLPGPVPAPAAAPVRRHRHAVHPRSACSSSCT